MNQQVLISLSIVVVVICTGLAAFGFHGRVSTIGVDLGTTFSVVGVRIGGKVKIIEDDQNHTIFPSVVSYYDNEEVVVGYNAISRLKSHPKMTIFNSKRFIGRSWEDESVQLYGNSHPFQITKCNKSISNYSTIAFEIPLNENTNSNNYDNNRVNTKLVSPEEVGSEVLKYLLDITNKYLGHKQVTKAVIAVPAKFTDEQRAATGDAYRRAGLKVVRVIEEPTAAAVAYDLHKKSNVHHILVYDFGGGTLDVSLLYVAKGSVQVYATDGDDQLGGSDFDMCLYDMIANKLSKLSTEFASLTNIHGNENELPDDGVDYTDLCVGPTIRQKAEQIKKDLSSVEEASFFCHIISPKTQKKQETIQLNISRHEFEDGCKTLFDRGMLPVHRLLTDLGMQKTDVDEIVLVGGTTRIPSIKKQLKVFFERDDLNDKIDPDVTVAYGAASILD